MKNLLIILSFFFLITNFINAQNPVAEFRFNGGSVYDETANGNNLSSLTDLVAAPNAQNENNRAVRVSQNYLFHPDVDALNMTSGITISGWFKLESFNGEWTALMSKWNDVAGSYYLGINSGNRTVRWNCVYANIEDTEPIPIGTWVHYVASYDGQFLKLYRDGELVNQEEAEGELLPIDIPFTIGAQSNLLDLNYSGTIDEVFVYDFALDAAEVQEVYTKTYTSLNKDLVFLCMELEQIQESTNPNNTLAGTIFNNGLEVINDFTINLSSNSLTTEVNFTDLNIQPYETFRINESFPLAIDVGQEISFIGELTNINGTIDEVGVNNFSGDDVKGLYFIPTRKVVIEEGTGTWCPWCPRGAVAMQLLEDKYPEKFIGIAVHNGDIMTLPEYDSEIGFMSFPGCHVDRTLISVGISPTAGELYYEERSHINNTPELGVTQAIDYDEATRLIDIEVTVDPALPLDGDYRVSIVITEDGVTGTSSAYNQANNYAGNNEGAMGGYEFLANPVPAAQMIYDHVARAVVGGVRGAEGSLPSNMVHAEKYSYRTAYELPEAFDADEINIVALILDAQSGVILNATKSKLSNSIVSVKELSNDYKLSLYPNPTQATSQLSLTLTNNSDVSISIFDTAGKLVESRDYGKLNGEQLINIMPGANRKGLFFINVRIDDEVLVKKLILE